MRIPLALVARSPPRRACAGCSLSSSGANVVNGKEQFVAKCGACHTLARANTTGVVGPNLDEAFQRARQDGFGEHTFEGLVHRQILHPAVLPQHDPETGKELPLMPAEARHRRGRPRRRRLRRPPRPRSTARTPARSPRSAVGKAKGTRREERRARHPGRPVGAPRLQVRQRHGQRRPGDDQVAEQGPIDHDISIEGNGVDEKGQVVKDGGTSQVQVDLKPGDYTFYCSVPGHREGGMEGKLTVK